MTINGAAEALRFSINDTDQTVSVTILGANDAPTISGIPDTAQVVTFGEAVALANFSVSDAENGNLDVTLTAINGAISGLVDSDSNMAGIQLAGTAAHINAVLADATFTANASANVSGDASIAILVTNANHATASATYRMTVENAGVSPMVEASVPSLPSINGAAAVLGDGNGDGAPDNQQAAVTSLPFFSKYFPAGGQGSAAPTYVTLVAGSNAGAVDSTGGHGAVLTHLQQLDVPAELPRAMDMPLGALSFSAEVDTKGLAETFSFFVESALDANGFWSQNSAEIWVNLATHIETVGNMTRIDFTITDGGAFDSDGAANGVIVADVGALGYMPLTTVGAIPDMPHDGFFF